MGVISGRAVEIAGSSGGSAMQTAWIEQLHRQFPEDFEGGHFQIGVYQPPVNTISDYRSDLVNPQDRGDEENPLGCPVSPELPGQGAVRFLENDFEGQARINTHQRALHRAPASIFPESQRCLQAGCRASSAICGCDPLLHRPPQELWKGILAMPLSLLFPFANAPGSDPGRKRHPGKPHRQFGRLQNLPLPEAHRSNHLKNRRRDDFFLARAPGGGEA